jgi:hypothetical protein
MEVLPLNPIQVERVVSVVEMDSMSGYGVLSLPKDDFREPPIADPHDGWCGEGRLNAVPYPIRRALLLYHNYSSTASQED